MAAPPFGLSFLFVFAVSAVAAVDLLLEPNDALVPIRIAAVAFGLGAATCLVAAKSLDSRGFRNVAALLAPAPFGVWSAIGSNLL